MPKDIASTYSLRDTAVQFQWQRQESRYSLRLLLPLLIIGTDSMC